MAQRAKINPLESQRSLSGERSVASQAEPLGDVGAAGKILNDVQPRPRPTAILHQRLHEAEEEERGAHRPQAPVAQQVDADEGGRALLRQAAGWALEGRHRLVAIFAWPGRIRLLAAQAAPFRGASHASAKTAAVCAGDRVCPSTAEPRELCPSKPRRTHLSLTAHLCFPLCLSAPRLCLSPSPSPSLSLSLRPPAQL
eukprot:12287943-Alexandrium_andersonii.AAC.1